MQGWEIQPCPIERLFMRRAEIILGSAWLILTAVILFEAIRLGFGYEQWGPASGFVVFWLAILQLICAAGILVKGWKMKRRDGFFLSRSAMWSAIWVTLTSALYCVLILTVGIYIATAVECALFSSWLGRHRWRTVLIFAVVTPVIIFYGIEVALMIPLPKSPLYGPGVLPF